jgi:polyhydroxyalkanoate synthesis regulator phasin
MGLGEIVQKAVYLGIGIASFAGEKANEKLGELKVQVQKLADEMVARGEMTAEEARKFVDEMVANAQQPPVEAADRPRPTEPRRIEIITDDEDMSSATPEPPKSEVDDMRQRVAELQAELRRLQNNA